MAYSLSSPGITETLFVPSKIILSVVNLTAFGFGVASGLTAILVPPIKIHLYVKCIIFEMKRPSLLCEMVFFASCTKLILCKMHSSLQKCVCHFHISSVGMTLAILVFTTFFYLNLFQTVLLVITFLV